MFGIDADERLEPTGNELAQGKTSRFFALEAIGNYLLAADRISDNIVVFGINQKTRRPDFQGGAMEALAPCSRGVRAGDIGDINLGARCVSRGASGLRCKASSAENQIRKANRHE